MTHKEFEEFAGRSVDKKVVMLLVDGRLFHRLEDGSWEEYPPYPLPA